MFSNKYAIRLLSSIKKKPTSTPLPFLDVPAVEVPDEFSHIDVENSLPSTGCSTINIQIPPKAPIEQVKVQPTVTGFIPSSKAYDDSWTTKDDQLLTFVLENTPEGKSFNWSLISSRYFPSKSSKNLKLRWSTFLKPKKSFKDRNSREIIALKKRAPSNFVSFEGRWCEIPSGKATQHPSEKVGTSTTGLTSYEYAVQAANEAEQTRRLKYSIESKRTIGKEKSEGKIFEDEVVWLREEDFVIREGIETFGEDWERIARGLKCRRRTAAECQERMRQLMNAC
jgi:hypothetical protein